MLRSRSTAVQSERTRRRSPGARQLDRPPKNSNFSVNVVLRASGCEMIAKVRRGALSSVRLLINPHQLCDEAAPARGRFRRVARRRFSDEPGRPCECLTSMGIRAGHFVGGLRRETSS